MSANSYNDLRAHIGHKIACACYGTKIDHPDNVVIECEDCSEVIMDFDRPDPNEVQPPPTRSDVETTAVALVNKIRDTGYDGLAEYLNDLIHDVEKMEKQS